MRQQLSGRQTRSPCGGCSSCFHCLLLPHCHCLTWQIAQGQQLKINGISLSLRYCFVGRGKGDGGGDNNEGGQEGNHSPLCSFVCHDDDNDNADDDEWRKHYGRRQLGQPTRPSPTNGSYQRHGVWQASGFRRPEAAEMGIKRKRELFGYDRWKLYLVKLFCGFIFICTLHHSPVTSMFLVFSWPVVIIPSGLWQARG